MNNKDRLKVSAKMLGIFTWAIATVATSVCAFNSHEDFYIISGVLNMIGCGIAIIKESKKK